MQRHTPMLSDRFVDAVLPHGRQGKKYTTGEKIKLDALEETLAVVLQTLTDAFPAEAQAHILSYQEIVDYLCFTLTMGARRMQMPDPPIDFDLYLTDRLPLNFAGNHVRLGDDMFLLLSLPSLFGGQADIYEELWQIFARRGIPCRHTQRILLFGEKEAEKELRSYMGKWCPSRRYIKELLTDGILKRLKQYHLEWVYKYYKAMESKEIIEGHIQKMKGNIYILAEHQVELHDRDVLEVYIERYSLGKGCIVRDWHLTRLLKPVYGAAYFYGYSEVPVEGVLARLKRPSWEVGQDAAHEEVESE